MSSVSPLHSDDGRKLLDVIDNLRLLPSISHEMSLPQIVVVGQQSAGKSSVLKAISNIDFPTNSGLCTQFATEIVCRRGAQEATKAQIIPATTVDAAYRGRLDDFSRRWSQVSPDQDISEIIESAKHVMGLDHRRMVSKDKLRLEFSGPTQDHISLIDLPGLFEQELLGQREDDKRIVDEMVQECIAGNQTIVLAVVSGAYDIQVQRIFKMFGPYQHRTMGIITAPDRVENGTERASTFVKLVANASFKAGHGWHVLRNLSHEEKQDGKDRDEVEKDYFIAQTTDPASVWTAVPSSRRGIKSLKCKLASLLQSSISEGLPQIQRQLRGALVECRSELDLLGNERVTPAQQRDYLADKSEALRVYTRTQLNGGNSVGSLRSEIRNANDRFANDMTEFGASWQFVPADAKSATTVSRIGLQPPTPISREQWLSSMLQEISNSRGRELDGLIDTIWVGRMFLRQNGKWQGIAENHIEAVFQIVESYFEQAMEDVVGYENADRFFTYAIQPELERRRIALGEKTAELLVPYSTEHVQTLNKHFRLHSQDLSSILADGADKKALTKNMVIHFTNIMDEYYHVALGVFMDNIESLAIENVLLRGLEDIMTAAKSYKMTEDEVATLAAESEEVTSMRQNLAKRLQDYEEGAKIVSQYAMRNQQHTHVRNSTQTVIGSPVSTSNVNSVTSAKDKSSPPAHQRRKNRTSRGSPLEGQPRNSETGSVFGQGSSGFSQKNSTAGQGSSLFNQGSSAFGQKSNIFGQGSSASGQASNGFKQGGSGFGQGGNGFSQGGSVTPWSLSNGNDAPPSGLFTTTGVPKKASAKPFSFALET